MTFKSKKQTLIPTSDSKNKDKKENYTKIRISKSTDAEEIKE